MRADSATARDVDVTRTAMRSATARHQFPVVADDFSEQTQAAQIEGRESNFCVQVLRELTGCGVLAKGGELHFRQVRAVDRTQERAIQYGELWGQGKAPLVNWFFGFSFLRVNLACCDLTDVRGSNRNRSRGDVQWKILRF
jgi:hypothetical protein